MLAGCQCARTLPQSFAEAQPLVGQPVTFVPDGYIDLGKDGDIDLVVAPGAAKDAAEFFELVNLLLEDYTRRGQQSPLAGAQ